jgi:hypothetical protein
MELPLLLAGQADPPRFRLHEVDDPIYKVRLCVCHGPEQAFCDDVNTTIQDDQPITPHPGAAARSCVARTPAGHLRVWIWLSSDQPTPDRARVAALVAHEALHGALGVFQAIGLAPTKKSEEALTYYVEWLTYEALQYLWG